MKRLFMAMSLVMVSCAPETSFAPDPAMFRSGPKPQRIAAYCVASNGKKVGNGECWTLADEAFRAAGAKRPGSDLRVWGRRVDPAKEGLRPGDVIEFQSAWFSDGVMTGSNHTAVVVNGGSHDKFTIAEQNWGRKTVRLREMDLTRLTAGKVSVYRP